MNKKITIGSRSSKLALIYAQTVKDKISIPSFVSLLAVALVMGSGIVVSQRIYKRDQKDKRKGYRGFRCSQVY